MIKSLSSNIILEINDNELFVVVSIDRKRNTNIVLFNCVCMYMRKILVLNLREEKKRRNFYIIHQLSVNSNLF
jgi:hypothetical protein